MAQFRKSDSLKLIRWFNEKWRPGQSVELNDGTITKTWSPAGIGKQTAAVVFVEGVQEPVLIDRLTVITD